MSQFVCVCLVGAVPLGDGERGLMMCSNSWRKLLTDSYTDTQTLITVSVWDMTHTHNNGLETEREGGT